MNATVIDKNRRMALPELVCEAGVEGGAFSF